MNLLFRLLTVLCYLLPFTFFVSTCNNDYEIKYAYNPAEANKNQLTERENHETKIDTTQPDTSKENSVDASLLKENEIKSSGSLSAFADKVLERLIRPTETSLSGLGCIFFYKNKPGKILMAVSILISLILLFGFRFVHSKKAIQYLLMGSILCHLAFIANSLFSEVSLLWGTWLLLVLLLLQIITEAKRKAKA